MKHDREAGDPLLDLLEDVEPQRRGHQHALVVLGALGRLELVGPVGGADGDGERVASASLDKLDGLVDLGEADAADDVFFDAAKLAQFGLDDDALLVGPIDDPPGDLDPVATQQEPGQDQGDEQHP